MRTTLSATVALSLAIAATACASKTSSVDIEEKVVVASAPVAAPAPTPAPAPVEAPKPPDTRVWIDASDLTLEGRGWAETSTAYSRLPARAEALVTPSVWRLSHNTAGVSVRFVTDSPAVHANWSGGGAMPHMPATGMSGLDLYRRKADGSWEFVANGRPLEGDTTRTLVSGQSGEMTEYRVYLPLYHNVDYLRIGVDEGKRLEPAAKDPRKPIVHYGTSIVQGGCASRPGMAHTSILERWLDWPTINLGFSGSAKMEPEMADFLGEIDAQMYVLDAFPNMTDELIDERFVAFIERLRSHRPDVPLVLVGHLKRRTSDAHLEKALAILQEKGIGNYRVIPGESLLRGPEEGTVDGIHPTDLGFLQMAEAMEPTLRAILDKARRP
jgi:lysophospholipase L1-like esterase